MSKSVQLRLETLHLKALVLAISKIYMYTHGETKKNMKIYEKLCGVEVSELDTTELFKAF